jgi:cell division transport system permease protein
VSLAASFVALVAESGAGLVRARRMTTISILTIAVSIFLVGVFLLVAENLRGLVETVRGETSVTVFLRPAVTGEARDDLARVARDSRLVGVVRHVTPEEARARFSSWWRSLAPAAGGMTPNPFPESLEFDLLPDAVRSDALPGFLRNLASHAAAEEVQFDVEWIRRLRGIVAVVRTGGTALALILVLGAAFTIANVVRLTILLHRDEIEILRLVGAPEFLIRGPFLLGGLVQGLLGGVLALSFLALAYRALVWWSSRAQENVAGLLGLRFLPPGTAALLVAGGLVAGLLGGGIAVRRRNLG